MLKNALKKGLKCTCCKMFIHKKCTGLKQSGFLFNTVSKDTVWECTDCQLKTFPFVTPIDHEIQNISFNSNFNCKCQTTVSDPNGPTYIHFDI